MGYCELAKNPLCLVFSVFEGISAVFDHPHDGKVSGELLCKLLLGNHSVADNALEFHTLAAGSGWNEAALLIVYRQGLNSEILTELACRDDNLTLDQLIILSMGQHPSTHTSHIPSPYPWFLCPAEIFWLVSRTRINRLVVPRL